MSYTRDESARVETILARAAHLRKRITPDRHYDRAELGAIRWLIEAAIATHGPLPAELERLRASIWPT